MNKIQSRIILSIICLSGLFGQNYYGSGAFANIGSSVNSLARGNTMFSDKYTSSSMFHNPANLHWIDDGLSFNMLNRNNNKYFGDYSVFSMAKPIDGSLLTWGLALIYLKVGDIDQYDDQANYISTFSSNEICASFGLSGFMNRQAWGGKLNLIYHSYPGLSNDIPLTVGVDIGYIYSLDWKPLNGYDFKIFPLLGVTLNRYFHFKDPLENKNYLPSTVRFGLQLAEWNYDIIPDQLGLNIQSYMDLVQQSDYPFKLAFGTAIGLAYPDWISLYFNMGKSGWYLKGMEQIKWNELNRYSSDFTYGISLKIEDKLENTVSSPVKDVIFGIAIVDHPYFKSTHYFSMSFSI